MTHVHYLKLADLAPGMTVRVDGGFTCMAEGEERVVKADVDGDLYIECAEGRHGLAGQLDDDGRLIGILDARDPISRLFVDFDAAMWADGYEMDGDAGTYTPNDAERGLIEDAVAGVVGDLHEQIRPLLEARDAAVRDAWSRQHGLNADGTPRRETVPADDPAGALAK